MGFEGKLLVATHNIGKLEELRQLLGSLPIDTLSLGEVGIMDEVEETGLTFAENAATKASSYARRASMVTLADDSGLEVNVLGGRPGVLSARYGGDISFSEKIEMLLDEIIATGENDRGARFVAAVAVADASGQILYRAAGICPGKIALRPRGSGGFGYDPVFVPEGFEQTFGELPESIKQEISHRARAFSQIMPFLRGFYAI